MSDDDHNLETTITKWRRWRQGVFLMLLTCLTNARFLGNSYTEYNKPIFEKDNLFYIKNSTQGQRNDKAKHAPPNNDNDTAIAQLWANPDKNDTVTINEVTIISSFTGFNKNDTSFNPSSCPSHYLQKEQRNEFSPLVFSRDNVVICRAAKVGSLELRMSSIAYEEGTSFAGVLNETMKLKQPLEGRFHTLAMVSNESLFRDYLYNTNHQEVHRIMFVRHPILRILSGFKQIAYEARFWEQHGLSNDTSIPKKAKPKSFKQWILNADMNHTIHQSFLKFYQSNCDNPTATLSADLDPLLQHYAPPQHCRCGIRDCHVQWQFYRLEDYNKSSSAIASILRQYLPEQYLAPMQKKKKHRAVHAKRYKKSDYLGGNERILEILNTATRMEQEYFGYKPLTLQDLD